VTAADDIDLARRCAAGDEDAWATFMRLYRSFMVEFARRIVPGVRAADVADAVIADLWQRGKINRFEGRSSLRTWLGALVANAALNSRRGTTAAAATDLAAATEGRIDAEPARSEAAAHAAAALTAAIAALPDEDRLLILMHYEQDLSLDECGAVFRMSKSTLSRRLAGIRDRIRTHADQISRERFATPIAQLRSAIDDQALQLDLRVACRGLGNGTPTDVSKE
jgi:RNA polymerase sigma-70 factor (ECF subfamily)